MPKQSTGGDSLDLEVFLQPDGLAKEVASHYHRWHVSRNKAIERWKETTNYVYATSTHETTNVQNEWSHSTHVPKITQIYDNLVSNYRSALFPHKDWLHFVGATADEEIREQRNIVESYLQTKHKQSEFENTILMLLQDWVLYGNCFAQVSYVAETHEDPDSGDINPGYIGPEVIRISPYDIVFNPLASDFKHSPKIVRSLKTMGQLYRELEESGDKEKTQDIIDKVTKFRGMLSDYSYSDIDKSEQLQFDGYGSISQYLESGLVEVLEFYGDIYDREKDEFLKNHVVTVIDRSWEIRSEPLNTYTGFPDIFHCGWRLRPDNIWAMGPLDNLVGMQYLIDHLENARADAFDQMLAPTRVLVGDVEEEDVVPGKPAGKFVIPTGDGSVSNLAPDTTVLNADVQIAQKAQQMEEYAGSPRESMGIRTPGEKTAFEVGQLQSAASRIFQNKIDYFEQQFLTKIVNAELSVAKRNMNVDDIARSTDKDTGVIDFINVSPENIAVKGKLVPVGASHFARQNQLSQNLQQLMQNLQSDPLLAQHFPTAKLAQTWNELLGFDSLDIIQLYGRIAEQAEAQRRSNAASQQIEAEDQTDLIEGGEGEVPPQQ